MNQIRALPLAFLITACPDDGGGAEATATEATNGTSDSTIGTSLTGEPTGGEPIDCPVPQGAPPDSPFFGDVEMLITPPGSLCQDLVDEGLLAAGSSWNLLITYPALVDGSDDDEKIEETWQPGRKPLVVFEHGSGGQNFRGYSHIFNPLAIEGMISASIEGGTASEPDVRAARILCTARWFASEWSERNERLNCDLVFMGHSAGGQGAALAARFRSLQFSDPANFLDLDAIVSIAPRGAGAGSFTPEQTAPFLTIQGARDEQVPGGAVVLFDELSPEESDAGNFGKAIVWAYDIDHDGFGGNGAIENFENVGTKDEMRKKGQAVATAYIVPFLRWRVLNELATPIREIFTGESIPGELDANPSWWNYLPNFNGDPVVFTAFTVDELKLGERRKLIDTFVRDVPGQTSPAQPSQASVVISPASLVDQVEIGGAFPLANSANKTNDAMRVDWSATDGLAPIEITWEFSAGLDVSDFSFLSLRVANILDIGSLANCAPVEPDDAIEFLITLSDGDEEVNILSSSVVPQDFGQVTRPGGVELCSWFQFFRTLRIPLNEFCEQTPLQLGSIRRVSLTFGAGGGSSVGGSNGGWYRVYGESF